MKNFHEMLVEHLFDGVYFVDNQRRILYWNKGAELLTGFTSEQMVGTDCPQAGLYHVDDCGKHLCQDGCPLANTVEDAQRREIEVNLRHMDGHRVPVRVRAVPVHGDNGEIVGVVEVFSDNTEKKKTEKDLGALRKMAYLDELTSLPNRRMVASELDSRQSAFERHGWPFGVIMIDIDHFKQINDRYGHDEGDRVLQMVSKTLQSASRLSDVVGRWGGEEFLAIIAAADPFSLRVVGERYRQMVATSQLPGSDPIRVTISSGAVVSSPGRTLKDVLLEADQLLYRAKEGGRNRLTMADD